MHISFRGLVRLSGHSHPSTVIAWLRARRIAFKLTPGGRPTASLDAVSAAAKSLAGTA